MAIVATRLCFTLLLLLTCPFLQSENAPLSDGGLAVSPARPGKLPVCLWQEGGGGAGLGQVARHHVLVEYKNTIF